MARRTEAVGETAASILPMLLSIEARVRAVEEGSERLAREVSHVGAVATGLKADLRAAIERAKDAVVAANIGAMR